MELNRSIEFDWSTGQSNKIEQEILCEFDNRTDAT